MHTITLFGYGKTAKAIAKKLGNCSVFDDKFNKISTDEFGNKLMPSSLFDPDKSTLEVTSAGIPPSNLMIKKAKNLISEYDFFLCSPHALEHIPFTIWISGTNGKTTTAQMLWHILKHRGSVLGGNVGTPLADLDQKAPIWILETSSFTLHYTKYAKPNIYLLLPITEDHISWHGSFKEYEKAKLKPLDKLKEGEAILLPKKYESYPTNGYKITYEDSDDLASFFGIDKTRIRFKDPFAMDAIIALATAKMLFNEIDYDLINSFEIDAHKLEEFADKKGRLWVNDSKATNIDATIKALKRYKDKKIYLILGGDDKGADLNPLFEHIKDYEVKIFAIGSNAAKLKTLAKHYDIECELSNELKEAISSIAKNPNFTADNCVALLSPAASSLDQFSSYAKRGEKFKEEVLR